MGLICSAERATTRRTSPPPSSTPRSTSCKKAVDSGQIRKFTGNDYAQDLAKGDIAACIGWSGDVIQLAGENDKVRFVAPDSGVMLFSDNMLVPNKATHKANAEELINYYYEPAVAAEARRVRQLHLPGRGRAGRDGRRSTPSWPTTR